jgi:hypothetical protein
MPVTSDDLWLINAGQSECAKLEQALDYIQTAMPIAGNASIQEFVLKRDVKIEFNHEGDIAYVPETKTIKWDPDLGVEIRDSEGNFLGVNSAASALLHEINHAIDPNNAENWEEKNATWQNDAERYAIQRTNEAMKEAGEIERTDHTGSLVNSPNPTEHTAHWDHFDNTDFGGPADLVWAQMDSAVGEVFGELFEMSDLLYGMPDIGGSPWGPFWPEAGTDSVKLPAAAMLADDSGVTLIGTALGTHAHAELMLM